MTFWAVVGALVVLYLFFVVIGSIDPQDNKVLAGIVLAMAVGWLAHAWRRIWKGGYSTHTERERRGF